MFNPTCHSHTCSCILTVMIWSAESVRGWGDYKVWNIFGDVLIWFNQTLQNDNILIGFLKMVNKNLIVVNSYVLYCIVMHKINCFVSSLVFQLLFSIFVFLKSKDFLLCMHKSDAVSTNIGYGCPSLLITDIGWEKKHICQSNVHYGSYHCGETFLRSLNPWEAISLKPSYQALVIFLLNLSTKLLWCWLQTARIHGSHFTPMPW